MQRLQEITPEEGQGWHSVDAGPELDVLFHTNRPLPGRAEDGIRRPSIVVAVKGRTGQILRFDPFDEDGHYHVRPTQADTPFPLLMDDGASPLETALSFFNIPESFRRLLIEAGEPEVAARVADEDLMGVPAQVVGISQAART